MFVARERCSSMAEGLDAGTRPDRLSLLIEQLVGGSDEADAALPAEVHRVIHPLCLNLLGSVDAAYEAEQETWRRLMEHLQRHGPGGTRIVNGTGYVQQIARNVCRDL